MHVAPTNAIRVVDHISVKGFWAAFFRRARQYEKFDTIEGQTDSGIIALQWKPDHQGTSLEKGGWREGEQGESVSGAFRTLVEIVSEMRRRSTKNVIRSERAPKGKWVLEQWPRDTSTPTRRWRNPPSKRKTMSEIKSGRVPERKPRPKKTI